MLILPLRPGDYARVVGRGEAPAGPAWTGWVSGEPVACAGIQIPWAGLGIAWAALTPRAPARAVHRAVRSWLDKLTVVDKLRRVEAVVDPRWPEALRWVRHLGFEFESEMPLYGPGGETMWRVVRLKEPR